MILTRGAQPEVSYDENAFLETHERTLVEQVWHEGRVVQPRAPTSKWPTHITWVKSNGHANPGAGRVLVSCLLWMKQHIECMTPDAEQTDDDDIQWCSFEWGCEWPGMPPTTLYDAKAVFQVVYDELEGGDMSCEPDDETCLLYSIFDNAENIMGAAQCGMEATDRAKLVAAIDDLCREIASAYTFEYTIV